MNLLCQEVYNGKPTTVVALYNKSVYILKKQKILVKEIVLEDNKPKLIDYEFKREKYNSFEDYPRGIKGRFLNRNNEELILL